eukprot:CAMPEP_0194080590 /NCGR_PEP_ID=MMETSP0149-20130528/6571_1 /TAXON_ID=122233 /ORGANISM="Chaetoceros debilis, Strain MM31A-1" /LENGTH=676 /DNA_ID=CAMNT_0038762341 /DNA_START=116 /DNA_END=2146 /DNA_ORIENTATION=+
MAGNKNAKRNQIRAKQKRDADAKAKAAAKAAATATAGAQFSSPPPRGGGAYMNTPTLPNTRTKAENRRSISENIMAWAGRELTSPNITGDLFQQEVIMRSNRTRKPMEPLTRLKANLSKLSGNIRNINVEMGQESQHNSNAGSEHSGLQYDSAAEPEEPQVKKQFTVKKVRKAGTWFGSLIGAGSNPDDFAYQPSGSATAYINWTFRSGFSIVFFSFVVLFLLLVALFGFLFTWAGNVNPQCIVVAGDTFGLNEGTEWWDGFSLSWTTFTTVGYGAVYTATGNDSPEQSKCAVIAILCTAESFFGLLYAGICTAIMFGKIGRIQSHAQVTFSDAMCVEYGKLEGDPGTTTRRASDGMNGSYSGASPVVSPVSSSEDSDRFVGERGVSKSVGHARGSMANINEEKEEDLDSEKEDNNEEDNDDGLTDQELSTIQNLSAGHAEPQDQDDDGPKKIICPVLRFQLVNQLSNYAGGEILDANLNFMVRKEAESYPYEPIARFLRVNLEEASHPFFNRVWHGRHVLNQDSPLVSVVARRKIEKNGGFWPEEYNNPAKVREHLRFSSVIITMTGISNVSAESVQIAKRYYHHDILIGYSFAPCLYKTEESAMLKVDMKLINDVVEQQASVPEKLSENEENRPSLRNHESIYVKQDSGVSIQKKNSSKREKYGSSRSSSDHSA